MSVALKFLEVEDTWGQKWPPLRKWWFYLVVFFVLSINIKVLVGFFNDNRIGMLLKDESGGSDPESIIDDATIACENEEAHDPEKAEEFI